MPDKIIFAPFVKAVPTTEIPITQDPLSGHIVNYNSDGKITFTPIDSFRNIIITGIKGEATPSSSPTPWNSGDPDLFEKWDIKTPGTYTNFLVSPINYIKPALEVGGIALNTGGTDSSVTTRGRTSFFYDIVFAAQLELIGDMLIQAIFYYDANNVFLSRQDVNAKTFISTIPPTAAKFKLSLFHTNNSLEVTQAELNALELNCYPATPIGNPVIVTADDLKNNYVQIWVTNGVSQKVLSEKPVNTTNIPQFEDLNFPVGEGVQAVYNGSVWEVDEGQTVTIADIPSTDVNSKWISLGLTLESTFRNYINPVLEVGGIALSNGATAPSNNRGRTSFFYDISFAAQLELVGDMLIQAIFYYDANNVFLSRQDVNAKTFISTIPPTAAKFKLSLFHTNNSLEVTQDELNALKLNCYSTTPTTMQKVVENSTNSVKVTTDYSSFKVNLGAGAYKESGRIVVNTGANVADSTGLRTGVISVNPGSHTITPKTGYKLSRVVNYKDGSYVSNNTTIISNNFQIDGSTTNQVRLVFEKNVPTEVITSQEITDFTFTLYNTTGNKFDDVAVQLAKPVVLPPTIYTNNQQTAILNNTDSEINFDLINRKLIITGGALIDSGNTVTGRITLPTSSTDMPSGITAGVVLYNKSNNTIVIQNQTAAPLLNHYILFTYRYSGAFAGFYVTGIKNYSVNGLPISQKDMRQSNRFAIDNFAIDYWSAPTQPAHDPTSLNSTDLYILYDALVEAYSSNVTKTVLGQTLSPTPYDVIRIDISYNRRAPANQRRRKPKIFVCGGIHGGEKLAVYSTYLFIKLLLENPNNDPIIKSLRNNYDWTIIPLVNPYALNVGQVGGVTSVRWNHNGVDINRNFDFNWAAYADGGVGSQSYKGTAAFSEKESQFVRDVFNLIKDDVVLYLDCHNFGSNGLADPRCAWFASTFNTVQNIVYSLCDRLDYEYKKRYAYLPENTLLAFSDIDGSSPMSQSWISNQQVVAVTLETDQSDFFNPVDPSNFNTNVMTRSLETYVNAFYSLGKHAVELYNSRF